jgi:hypothetical protein
MDTQGLFLKLRFYQQLLRSRHPHLRASPRVGAGEPKSLTLTDKSGFTHQGP